MDSRAAVDRSTPSPCPLGIASDVVTLGGYGTALGFDIAKKATNVGFGIATTCIAGSAAGIEHVAGANAATSTLQALGTVVGLAHRATATGQDIARGITEASLGTTQAALRAAGAQSGELLRVSIGQEAADAVATVDAIVRRFATPLHGGPAMPQLLAAANAWRALQKASRAERREEVEVEVAELPPDAERLLRFTAATFGHLWFAGLLEGFSVSGLQKAQAVKDRGGSPGDMAIASAGLDGNIEVLEFDQSGSGMYTPGYLVAVDHDHDQVVLALRGTSTLGDAMADLICEAAPVELGGHAGHAHDGMLRAAWKLSEPLAALAERGLARLDSDRRKRVVIAGHSLGAGVASLVAALWRDAGRFASVDVRCLAFACPQVLDAELAVAQSNHITSFVLGDDLVPRFSLATATDLREAMLVLHDPVSAGLPAALQTDAVLAAESRGATAELARLYAEVRPRICAAEGRLYPPGRVVHLLAEDGPARVMKHSDVDELWISSTMASDHMPRPYLLALKRISGGSGM